MHLRPDHTVRDLPTLHAFIHAHPLGVLTTSLPSENYPTLQCSHIPWVVDSENTTISTDAPNSSNKPLLGGLRGHIARQNPQSKAIVEAATESPTKHTIPGEVLIIFTSPVDHYITPHFYTESKLGTGKVAPTWNYAAVQVYGRATIYHDSKDEATGAFLHQQLSDLARLGEEGVMGYQKDAQTTPQPWKIADAPEQYIALLKKNIVGMHIEITRIEGRFKVSQERPVQDRAGVVEGLEAIDSEQARKMAGFVKKGEVIPPQK
ncbi:FMN-binding split barrel-related protein [Penicillium lagena]|uniref:FMN-binding split barrel-related protein n=1 Tax=Penicillium lagena TaxID=94218 RepID=UPI00254264DC|nr:FMN-binding split barrel-related protein [Penicillium lagena]KAJ5610258.1 FMN-binding split barrel-related protein [Penicillium lagena]